MELHDEIIALKILAKLGVGLTIVAGIAVFVALLTLVIEK